MNDFDQEFEALAAQIAKEAQKAETLMDKVDAMKALQPYYALRKKTKAPGATPGTMDDLRSKIRSVESNHGADAA
jgi:hypothetical protein